jgi:hypothetical protein
MQICFVSSNTSPHTRRDAVPIRRPREPAPLSYAIAECRMLESGAVSVNSKPNSTALKKRPGLPAHVPSEKDRKLVQLCMAQGYTVERTASLIGIGVTTLKKYYAEELQNGSDKALTAVAGTLFSIATDRSHPKCATAAIFLLKAKGGWRENASLEAEEASPTTFSINIGNAGPSSS